MKRGWAALTAVLVVGPAAGGEKILNGGFELGSFVGWTAATTLGDELEPWVIDGFGFFQNGGPFEGAHWGQNGFDGCGPGEYTLTQRVFVEADSVATFSWAERIQWDLTFGATLPRTYTVLVEDTEVYSFSLDPGTTGDTGYVQHTVDVSSFGGDFAEVTFREDVPECFTGPAQFSIDSVSLFTEDAEVTVACETSCLIECPGGRIVYVLSGHNDGDADALITADLVTPGPVLPLLSATVPPGPFELTRVQALPRNRPPPAQCPMDLTVEATITGAGGGLASVSCTVTAVRPD